MKSELIVFKNERSHRIGLSESLCPKSVVDARKYTEFAFKNTQLIQGLKNFDYPLIWSLYDTFFNFVAHPVFELKNILKIIDGADRVEGINLPEEHCDIIRNYCLIKGIKWQGNHHQVGQKGKVINTLVEAFLLIYSIVSIFILALDRRKKVGIWTGDYYNEETKSDPRLGKLYQSVNSPIVEFIRTTSVHPKKIFSNLLARKRAVVYYKSFHYFQTAFAPKSDKLIKGSNDLESLLLTCLQAHVSKANTIPSLVNLWRWTFKALNIDTFIPWFLSSRTVELLWAAKSLNIKTIGFMHGMSAMGQMSHEYMPEYQGDPLSTDVFGVWSDSWKTKFNQLSSLYSQEGVQVCGPLKPKAFEIKANNKTWEKTRVLIIAEQNTPPSQLYHYMEQLLADSFEVMIKARHFAKDLYVDQIKTERPDLLEKIEVWSIPLEEALVKVDIVIGTHSTAVLEAAYYNLPLLFLNTDMLGDYFDISNFESNYSMFVDGEEVLADSIRKAIATHNETDAKRIISEFFGKGNAIDWIVKQINL